MSTDHDHVVLTLPRGERGERGELRVSRSTYKGSAPFTKLQLWYPADDSAEAELLPGKVITVKDLELAQLIGVLIKIDKKQTAAKAPEPAPAARRTQHRTVTVAEQLAEDARLF